MKRLFIREGHSLSLQYHEKKAEAVCVVSGKIELTLGNLTDFGYELSSPRFMKPWEFIHLPPRKVHRFRALENAVLIEASTPEADDVVRLEDNYGMKGTSAP
mgnify:CR=1 FL=1